ncbi:hypothetical protein DID88_003166 [Monilinia fructigena]|uniref:Calcium channel YVC1-like C-terminal transmembrane domain-containing protein n=1 Tax=Monilinia fructigena TaxID=38457 RepID=A0A395IW92_9HELO|nr:hypothetical protein DID88_003166 [Monilinia fructigena]
MLSSLLRPKKTRRRGDEEELGEDGDEGQPLLPIFSAAHLDALPVYNLTHAIRLIVLPRTETTLTWDQLRSPQVSQFLVKPMQQQIRTSHFSRATLYALMANCLQFRKESQANPGNAGNSLTRALVYPPITNWNQRNRPRPVAARTSTLEVAIRASAKRFLAHPLVVQQLEAIWAGTIVFHSAADNLHRTSINRADYRKQSPSNGSAVPLLTQPETQQAIQTLTRRTITLYDPRDASLFKLSRLRVPRYRQFFSTCSLAILLGLFLAVLSQRSTDITGLEVIFWFWSAGFMLDEVVGFNEQGFSLYIMSFWNAFDLGILVLLTIYYCMRLYGIFLVDYGREEWNILTNSFMSIVSNANEEHQFVFAVNTISMVKNDALFSYVAPTNIIAWVFTPFRFVFPFRTFIKMNRTVIKITHFPLLFSICAYEKIFLARSVFEPTDLIEKVGQRRKRTISFQDHRRGLFSPNLRRHESSVTGFQKDRALDEVFRLAPRDTPGRNRPSFDRRQTHNVINNWMDRQVDVASPQEQDPSILERLERRRQSRKTTMMRCRGISREISGNRSVASDPAEFMSTGFHDMTRMSDDEMHQNSFSGDDTDADGDDELLTNDEDEAHTEDKHTATNFSRSAESEEDYFQTPIATRFVSPATAFGCKPRSCPRIWLASKAQSYT